MMSPPPLDARRHALFLDFDGTLVGFEDDPSAVAVDPRVAGRLAELSLALDGALGVVSGRRVSDLDRFLHPLVFAAAGVHGLERRAGSGGEIHMLAGPDSLDTVRAALGRDLPGEPRLELEDKGTALVLHYRKAPEMAEAARDLMRRAVATRDDLVVMVGNAIVEVHPAGMDKGRAVADLMTAPPFAGRVPIYLGDDTTDEYALRWVREAGGVSVKVGPAPSGAEFRLADVAAVHRWLGARVR